MLPRPLLPLLGLALASLLGCTAPTSAEGTAGTDSALSGTVKTGMITTTTSDGLRLRKTPDKTDASNVIGLIPLGASVMILAATPTNGFYRLRVLDGYPKEQLPIDTGWVYGDYLKGKAAEPKTPAADVSLTGTHDVDTIASVDWIASDCTDLTDDKGRSMTSSVDDVLLGGGRAFALIGIDTNTFSYGSSASIEEIDRKSQFNPGGTKVPLKIVKTSATQPEAGFTVTICMSASSKELLPTDAHGRLTLHVH